MSRLIGEKGEGIELSVISPSVEGVPEARTWPLTPPVPEPVSTSGVEIRTRRRWLWLGLLAVAVGGAIWASLVIRGASLYDSTRRRVPNQRHVASFQSWSRKPVEET